MRNPLPPKAVSTESGRESRVFHKKKFSEISPLIMYNPNLDSESISDFNYTGGVASTSFDSTTSSIDDWFQDAAASSQQGRIKAKAEGKSLAPQGVTQSEKNTKLNSYSGQEKKMQVCDNLVSISTEKGGKYTESLPKHFVGSFSDPHILSKLKKEFDKGDEGLMSCLSFLKKTIDEQKQVHQQLRSRIKEEDLLFRSLGDKVRKAKAKLYEAHEVHNKSQQTSVAKKYTTEDEQKESSLSTRKIVNQKGSSSRSTKSRTQPLLLKMNQLR